MRRRFLVKRKGQSKGHYNVSAKISFVSGWGNKTTDSSFWSSCSSHKNSGRDGERESSKPQALQLCTALVLLIYDLNSLTNWDWSDQATKEGREFSPDLHCGDPKDSHILTVHRTLCG